MDTLSLLMNPAIVVSIFTAAYLFHKVIVYFRTRQFPGPPSTGFSSFLLTKAIYSEKGNEWYTHVSKTYGRYHQEDQTLFKLGHLSKYCKVLLRGLLRILYLFPPRSSGYMRTKTSATLNQIGFTIPFDLSIVEIASSVRQMAKNMTL